MLFAITTTGSVWADDDDDREGSSDRSSSSLTIGSASWSQRRGRLTMSGEKSRSETVTLVNAFDTSQVLGRDNDDEDRDWRVRARRLNTVPCRVRAMSNGQTVERNVSNAPADCAPKNNDVVVNNDDGDSSDADANNPPAPPPANVAPGANANGPYSDINGVEVSFSSAGSSDPDGNIVTYSWSFGDGSSSNNANPNHTYEVAGNYTVRLIVTDNDGASDTDITTANIADNQPTPPANVAPTADANGPYSGTTGETVSFSSAGSNDSDGNIASRSWTFGDGGSSTAANPSHTYANAGTYTVTLTVRDNDGATGSDTARATITDPDQPPANIPPAANANGPYSGTTDAAVSFSSDGSNDSDGSIVAFSWDFGDGGSSTQANPSHTYANAGAYTVTLTVTDNDNATDNNATTATIQAPDQPPVVSQCPDPLPTTLPDAHELCTTPYTGPEVCLQCHEGEARDMHGSVHYQQNGPTDFVTNIDGLGGERGFDFAATGINTYCGSHENSPRFTCAGCHVGNGRYPMAQAEFEALPPASQAAHDQLANIDCLTCHQEQYRRFPNWINANGMVDIDNMFEPLTLENVTLDGSGNLAASPGDTVTRTGLEGIPAVDPITLDFEFAPAGALGSISFELPADSPFAPMAITTEVAVKTVHRTTRKSCLSCHAGAAGADGAKRGDLTSLHANPDLGLDQHMSPAGADMTCSDCHNVTGDNGESHRVRGRGLDVRPNDVADRFTCESCHDDRPHGDFDFNSPTEDTHAVKVACQTCHIPTYGKGIATETSRDWQDAHLSQSACNGRGGWLPREDKGTDLIPSYAWDDGTSQVYFMGEPLDSVPTVPLAADVAQRFVGNFSSGDPAVVLGAPNAIIAADGSIDMTLGINNPDAKLQAMKEHWGKLARNDNSNTLIAHSTYDFFRTGDYDLAVESGLAQDPVMNANDPYTVVPVHTFQTLNHGVETRGSALDCNNCHRSLSSNARIDLENDYGYGLRTGNSAVNGSRISGTLNGDLDRICQQCHGNETSTNERSFTQVHNRHVAGRSRDCASCHNFSRLDVRTGLNLNN